ncbi:ABC transporter substrate-binding protein [Oceanobacillus polygoni]|uniref:Iron complex transport system substrate-binding protein n=1 Tax=Oceanobacillus polygoni TaxID=1235259 RepID=A0A9X1CDG5_9BACI|nr:ABC transporter substrate-binding protein [Oceanobacillus polygoni]MBP2079031.1 iron complex transport system substrate-binding protein [Oceanobacillus polygoni]
MKLRSQLFILLLIGLLALVGCNTGDTSKESEASVNGSDTSESETREITYLGETYTVPANVERIVITGAMEAMEDAMALEVEPVGAITLGGEFPDVFKEAMGEAESIGEKQEPNFEKILQLKPDVILGTTKFPEEVVSKLEQIAPTILVSHISTDWEDNLLLMAALSGKENEAETLLNDYEQGVDTVKADLSEDFEDQTVLSIRVRAGKMFIYPEDVFFNPILYSELELNAPEAVMKAEAQEEISIEQLAEMNPDYIFMQVQQTGTQENEQAFEQLKQNSIIQNIDAFKEDHVYVNIVDSLLEGGSVYSKNEFLKALQDN